MIATICVYIEKKYKTKILEGAAMATLDASRIFVSLFVNRHRHQIIE
jgi:hypothetical protein